MAGSKRKQFLTVRDISYAVERLGGKSIEDAAVAAGFKAQSGKDLEKKPLIQQFIQDYQKRIAEDLAKREAPRLEKVAVSRTWIIDRLAQLAAMEPCGVAENISAQVKACAELAEIFSMKVNLSADMTNEFRTRSNEDLEHFIQHGTFLDGSRPIALAGPGTGEAGAGTPKVQ